MNFPRSASCPSRIEVPHVESTILNLIVSERGDPYCSQRPTARKRSRSPPINAASGREQGRGLTTRRPASSLLHRSSVEKGHVIAEVSRFLSLSRREARAQGVRLRHIRSIRQLRTSRKGNQVRYWGRWWGCTALSASIISPLTLPAREERAARRGRGIRAGES